MAEPQDDAALAGLLNNNAIPGWVTLSYRTQLGFHRPLWSEMPGESVIGTRLSDGAAGGMATRSVQPAFLGGQAARIGWLGQLRVGKEFRNRAHLLRGGFDAVRAFLHDPVETPWYLASIIQGNERARRILEAGLEGFPRFEPLFAFHTLVFSSAGSARNLPPGIRLGEPGDMPAVAAFLDRENRHRDGAPRLRDGEAFPAAWRNLSPGDFLLHETGAELNGVAAVWSQKLFRSLLVSGYRPPVGSLRPLLNLVAPLARLPCLPAPGRSLDHAYLALPTVADDAPEVWRALGQAALTLAQRRNIGLLAAGFADADPAAAILRGLRRCLCYGSTIYRVSWEDQVDASAFRKPKLEIGLL